MFMNMYMFHAINAAPIKVTVDSTVITADSTIITADRI